jgi:protocatechuate 3,4-dioxygenase beta subunit
LTATKEGFAPGRANVPFNKMSGVKIVLRPGATLEGTVRNAKGKPIAGATVMLGEDISTLSDAEGRWSLARIEKETYDLVAEKGNLRSKPKTMDIGWNDHIKAVNLVLKKKKKNTFNVSGVVVDAVDGKPIPKVRLRFWSLGKRGEKKTDSKGRFRFKAVPAGGRHLYFRGMPKRYVKPLKDVEFTIEDRDVDDLVIKLPRGAAVEGTVLLPSGEGAWEAKIRAIHPSYTRSGRARRLKVTADSKGRFKASGILAGVGYQIRAELDGYPPAISEPFNLRQGETVKGVKLRFQKAGSLSGSIKDAQGKPLTKKYWLIARFPGLDDGAWNNSWMTGRIRPDKSGQFKMTGLTPGRVAVQLWREGRGLDGSPGACGIFRQKVVEVASGEETKNVDFVVGASTGKKPKKLDGYIAGRVVSIASDEGIPGIQIYARGSGVPWGKGQSGSAKTGPDGSFRIKGLRPGAFTLRANYRQQAGYDEQQLTDIPCPSDDIPVVLRRLCTIEGQVIDKVTGEPVTEFTIGDVGSKTQRIRDAEGRFRLKNIPRGACQLRVVSEAGVAQRCLELEEGETARDVVLTVHEPFRVTGRVVRATDGTPVAGAVVTAKSLARKKKHTGSTTGPDGRFSIEGVFPGTETLYVAHPDFGRPWFPDIEIPDSLAPDDVVLKLEPGAKARGRVFFEKGFPYEDVELRLQPGEGEGWSRDFHPKTMTGYEGDYEFSGVPPGKYTVIWNMRDPEVGRGGYWGKTVTLKAGETATVDFGTGGAVVSGVVVDRGKPKNLAVVTFTSEGVMRRVQTDREGKYRVYGIEPGEWRVRLTMPGRRDYSYADKKIAIPEEGSVQLDFDMSAAKPRKIE